MGKDFFRFFVVRNTEQQCKTRAKTLLMVAAAEGIAQIGVILLFLRPEMCIDGVLEASGLFGIGAARQPKRGGHFVGKNVGMIIQTVGREGKHGDADTGIDAKLAVLFGKGHDRAGAVPGIDIGIGGDVVAIAGRTAEKVLFGVKFRGFKIGEGVDGSAVGMRQKFTVAGAEV